MLIYDFMIQVTLSMILGFLIGLERQLTGHMAGIRINVLLCMGTCFFTLFPLLYGSDEVFRIAICAAGILIISNLLFRPLAQKISPITTNEESEKQYCITVVCQADAENDIRSLLINTNVCKTLFLNHLESGDVIGDKVEIIAMYCSFGKPKNHVLEGIVGKILNQSEVVSAGWEVL